ncbi:MAG: hypothetical protein HKN36_10055 [Hellea sp.]|nr:hypothetical protein [Hellea sp.]
MSNLAEEFHALNAMMEAETSQAVKYWMNWMMLVFVASILFVWKYKPARTVLLVLVGTMIGAMIAWMAFKNVHLFGIVHLVLWLPLAIYLWKNVLSKSAKITVSENPSAYDRAFYFWVCLVFLTILISLVFDVRDIFLVLTGGK